MEKLDNLRDLPMHNFDFIYALKYLDERQKYSFNSSQFLPKLYMIEEQRIEFLESEIEFLRTKFNDDDKWILKFDGNYVKNI